LAQHEILQQRRAAGTGAQRVLVVADRDALVGGERRMRAAGGLVQLVAVAAGVVAGRLARGHGCFRWEGVVQIGCPVVKALSSKKKAPRRRGFEWSGWRTAYDTIG